MKTVFTIQEQKKPCFLWTSCGPSSESMHPGHSIPFNSTKSATLVVKRREGRTHCECHFSLCRCLQDAFDVSLERYRTWGRRSTCLWKCQRYHRLWIRPTRNLHFLRFRWHSVSDALLAGSSLSRSRRCFLVGMLDFTESGCIEKSAFTAIQTAPSISSSLPSIFGEKLKQELACLIPCAIEQVRRTVHHSLRDDSFRLLNRIHLSE